MNPNHYLIDIKWNIKDDIPTEYDLDKIIFDVILICNDRIEINKKENKGVSLKQILKSIKTWGEILHNNYENYEHDELEKLYGLKQFEFNYEMYPKFNGLERINSAGECVYRMLS